MIRVVLVTAATLAGTSWVAISVVEADRLAVAPADER